MSWGHGHDDHGHHWHESWWSGWILSGFWTAAWPATQLTWIFAGLITWLFGWGWWGGHDDHHH